MSDSVQMPALGESVTEGTVTRWLKQVGDQVAVDEPLLEVSTDKVDTEIPSPFAGVLERILVSEDETVLVGADLAVIGEGSDGSGGDAGSTTGQETGQQDQSSQPTAEQSQPDQTEQDQPQQDQAQQDQPQQDQTQEEQQDQSQQDQRERGQPQQGQAPQHRASQDGQEGGAQGGSAGQGTSVKMPALGESVTEGTVTRWLKQEGDQVAIDDPLLEVSTDKVDTEIPSPVAGVLQKILVGEDETVAVGADLAIVSAEGAGGSADGTAQAVSAPDQDSSAEAPAAESAPAEAPAAEEPSADSTAEQEPEQPAAESESEQRPAEQPGAAQPGPRQPATQSTAQTQEPASPSGGETTAPPVPRQPSPVSGSEGAGYVTPLVRRMASDNGIDLASITGTGVGGRIRKQDVLEAAKAKQESEKAAQAAPAGDAAPAAGSGRAAASRQAAPVSALRGQTVKMSRLRKVIAQRMVESLQTSAQLTTVVEVDVSRIARLRDRAKNDFAAREGAKLSFLPFFALAAIEGLKQYPQLNASIDGDSISYHAQENLGVAVDTERGLVVPVIHNAGDLNIAGLARRIADVADRTRNNRITPDDLAGGTFTLTNTGSRGALFDTPIINQPQVGILGTGAVVKRPVVVADSDGGESVAIRSMAFLALSYDHRLVDGADAARFLATLKERLEEGAFEADLGL